MKYHLKLESGKTACGAPIRPDTFSYPEKQFTQHYAKEYECKKCVATIKK